MKKLVSLILSFALVMSVSCTSVFASENVVSNNSQSQELSYINQNGESITILINANENIFTSKVYVNGLLSQKSVANSINKTIATDIYSYDVLNVNSERLQSQETKSINDYKNTITYNPTSNEKIEISKQSLSLASIYDEPVTNNGLQSSVFGDGYYFLGSSGGYYYAPNLYGYLFRDYTCSYDGESRHWSWSEGDTLSAISAYISLFGGPVTAIVGMLVFASGEILAYNQSVDLETYTFDYQYRVRVQHVSYFETSRNITYWKIYNTATGNTTWDRKSFNYGFSLSNSEMIKAGIDNYLEQNPS